MGGHGEDRALLPSADQPDEALVRLVQGGDHDAFGVLVQRHQARLYNLAYRMIGRTEDARDAVQDALLSCFRHIDSFRGDASFSTWLHRITVNACYDALRKRSPTPMDPAGLPEASSGVDPAESAAAAADVQRALLRVPEEFRAVIVMHDLLDVSVEDVAAALELPVGTVKSRLHRGRIHLGRALSADTWSGPVPTAAPSTDREPQEVPGPSKPPNP